MNKSKIKKKRKQKYIEVISYIAFEIDIAFCTDSYWKRKLDTLLLENTIDISYKDKKYLPEYIKKEIVRNKLRFSVKLLSPNNSKDNNQTILEFSSKEFPQITSEAKITNCQ